MIVHVPYANKKLCTSVSHWTNSFFRLTLHHITFSIYFNILSSDFCEEDEKETYKDWGDRINSEYHRKRQYQYQAANSHRTSGRKTDKNEERKAEEKQARKRKFQEKLEKEHKEYQERIKKARLEKQNQSLRILKDAYEMRCKEFFSSKSEHENVGYRDVPWPYTKEAGVSGTRQFILCDVDETDSSKLKKYLRAQQVRWHPDKFMQKCGQRLIELEKAKIMARVNLVSQELHKIIDDLIP